MLSEINDHDNHDSIVELEAPQIASDEDIFSAEDIDLPSGPVSIPIQDLSSIDPSPATISEVSNQQNFGNAETTTPSSDDISKSAHREIEFENLNLFLELAVKNGNINDDVAETILNFVSNGMSTKDGMQVASIAIKGLDLKDISHLCLLAISGVGVNEIQRVGGQLLNNYQDVQAEKSHLSSNFNNHSGRSILGDAFKGLRSLIGNTVRSPMKEINGIRNVAGRDEDNVFGMDDRDPIVGEIAAHPEQTFMASVERLESVFSRFGETRPGIEENRAMMDSAMIQLGDDAQSFIGSATSVEEAQTYFDKVREKRKSLVQFAEMFLTDQDLSKADDFFRKLDDQLKRLLAAIKSKITSDQDSIGEVKEHHDDDTATLDKSNNL